LINAFVFAPFSQTCQRTCVGFKFAGLYFCAACANTCGNLLLMYVYTATYGHHFCSFCCKNAKYSSRLVCLLFY